MYTCLNKQSFADQVGYQLIPLQEREMEKIRLWRNAQIDILRQKRPISFDEQQEYFQTMIQPTFTQLHPSQILFIYLFHDVCIGYGGLTHLDWDNRRAEISFLVNPERGQDPFLYQKDFSHYLALVSQIAFEELKLHRLYTETFAFRTWHMSILEHCGFKQEGILRHHVYKKEQWIDSWMHGLLAQEHFYAP
jgi:RimJ/RimL family protein N-acetyltransferase